MNKTFENILQLKFTKNKVNISQKLKLKTGFKTFKTHNYKK